MDDGLLGRLTSHRHTVQSVPPVARSRYFAFGRNARDVTNAADDAAGDEVSMQCCKSVHLFAAAAVDADEDEFKFALNLLGMESVTLANPSSSADAM